MAVVAEASNATVATEKRGSVSLSGVVCIFPRHRARKQQGDATGLRDRLAACNSEIDRAVLVRREVEAAGGGGQGKRGELRGKPKPELANVHAAAKPPQVTSP